MANRGAAFEDRLTNWSRYLTNVGAGLLVAASAMALLNVVTRKVFAHPFSWSDELVGFLGVWVVYLPLVLMELTNSHLRVTVLYDLFSPGVRWWLDRFHDLFVICILGYFAYLGVGVVQMNAALSVHSPTLGIPLALLYAIIPFAFGFGALARLLRGGAALLNRQEKGA